MEARRGANQLPVLTKGGSLHNGRRDEAEKGLAVMPRRAPSNAVAG